MSEIKLCPCAWKPMDRTEEEKKWGEEARRKAEVGAICFSVHDKDCFVLGYLQACKVRQEEIDMIQDHADKLGEIISSQTLKRLQLEEEIERLKKIIVKLLSGDLLQECIDEIDKEAK